MIIKTPAELPSRRTQSDVYRAIDSQTPVGPRTLPGRNVEIIIAINKIVNGVRRNLSRFTPLRGPLPIVNNVRVLFDY